MTGALRLAVLLAFWLHLPLVFSGLYRYSFDSYVHMFFADHYVRDWWSLWEARWYTGFTVTSYPPLVHQVIALLTPALGLSRAFGVALLAMLVTFPIAVHSFARVFVSPRAAGFTALAAVFLPSLSLAAYTFGQLPTLVSTLLMLLAASRLASFLRRGSWLELALLAALVGAGAGAHHATTVFAVPIVFTAVALAVWLDTPRAFRLVPRRGLVAAVVVALVTLLVIAPFWIWQVGYRDQVPIDHLSRHNYLVDLSAQDLFFWAEFGVLPAALIFALRGLRRRHLAPLSVAAIPLFALGLGGTTPVPSWLYGQRWAWLTYDRFALWAGLCLLPFVGLAADRLRPRFPEHRRLLSLGAVAIGTFFVSQAIVTIINAHLPLLRPFQPAPIDIRPVVQFLDEADHRRWRYLTLGFGEQMIHVTFSTAAQSVDGGYHTARTLPALQESGVGQLDYALWWDPSGNALRPFLAHPERYALRWVFVNEAQYEPHLRRNDWALFADLSNGVRVWHRPGIPAIDTVPAPYYAPMLRVAWGTLPLAAMAASVVLWLVHARQAHPNWSPAGIGRRSLASVGAK
ncbi:MAG: hypothetical protein CL878_12530 [Dehalococcoidia bacterium]|nr:hypothetical protein [Dehalococcoidia bacterium]